MFTNNIRIYVSKSIAEKIGFNYGKGEFVVKTQSQLEALKNYTSDFQYGNKGYTITYDDKTRTAYGNDGTLEYYESSYNSDFPMFGAGKDFGLSNGDLGNKLEVLAFSSLFSSLFRIGGGKILNKNKVFPKNPNDFKPKGLTRRDFKNGDIKKWFNDDGKAIYEWNKDSKFGDHYHYTPDGKNRVPGKSGNTHLYAGESVP